MLDYLTYFNIPEKVFIVLFIVTFIINIIGELLEFKGKVVPEYVKFRKYFNRKKVERQTMKDVVAMMPEVKNAVEILPAVKETLESLNSHYSKDNISMRNEWMDAVNEKQDRYDNWAKEFDKKLDENSQITLSLLIDIKRDAIINFASKVIDTQNLVTREQFKRIFKIYDEYESCIEAHGLTNGEVDVAIRIIRESYESHMREHTFIEDVKGY